MLKALEAERSPVVLTERRDHLPTSKPASRTSCANELLPEESQRATAAQALGVSRGNDFALLDRRGGDVTGALKLLPPGGSARPGSATNPAR